MDSHPTNVRCPACGAEANTWCWANKSAGVRRQKPHGSRITFWQKVRRLAQRGLAS